VVTRGFDFPVLAIIIIFITTIMIIISSSQQQVALAKDVELDIEVHHGGAGEAQICLKIKGYNDICRDYDLQRFANPFIKPISVEDPHKGKNFKVCYRVNTQGSETCQGFEFNGEGTQTVSIILPNTGTGELLNSNDVSGSTGSFSAGQGQQHQQEPQSFTAVPPLPTSQQEVVSWKTFSNSLLTIQYPSNWELGPRHRDSGPIDIEFVFNVNGQGHAIFHLFKYQDMDPMSSNSLADIGLDASKKSLTNFMPEQGIECTKYTINGIPACSYTGSFDSEKGMNNKILDIVAGDPITGNKYDVEFMVSPNLYDHFLPVVDQMVKSFKVTS
jgi:hypothetical protein